MNIYDSKRNANFCAYFLPFSNSSFIFLALIPGEVGEYGGDCDDRL